MKKLERQELEAIIGISNNIDFIKFIEILERSVKELALHNATVSDDTQNKWNQGRIQELLDILKKIRDANDDLVYQVRQARKP